MLEVRHYVAGKKGKRKENKIEKAGKSTLYRRRKSRINIKKRLEYIKSYIWSYLERNGKEKRKLYSVPGVNVRCEIIEEEKEERLWRRRRVDEG